MMTMGMMTIMRRRREEGLLANAREEERWVW